MKGGGIIIIIASAVVTLPRSWPRTRPPIGTVHRIIVPSSDKVIIKSNEHKEKEILHREQDHGDGNSVL